MTVNADLARIYGSDFDAIHLAPYGTTLPTTLDGALDPAFEDVGWLHSDGLTETLTGSVNRIRGHRAEVKRANGRLDQAKAELLAIADELENKYGAKINAAFVREACEVYENRGRLRQD